MAMRRKLLRAQRKPLSAPPDSKGPEPWNQPPRPAKKIRTAGPSTAEESSAKSVIVKFEDTNGNPQGTQLEIPLNATPKQLGQLINELLQNDETIPYAFYVEQTEVVGDLLTLINERKISIETVVTIQYQPLSVFRVRPVTRCTDTMPGHSGAILHCSFSPDGKKLVSGGGDCVVRFWDTATCTPQYTAKGHKDHVLATAYSPNGKYFASGDKRGEIRVWDPSTGKCIRVLKRHKKWITALSWEPIHRNKKGERLVSASKDCTIKVFNVRTGRCEWSSAHQLSVECVKWGGEGFIYSGSRDRTICVWAAEGKADGGKLVRQLKAHAHRVNAIALNTDLVCRSGGYDHENRKFSSDDEMYEAAVRRYEKIHSKDSERLVSAADDFTCFLWNPTKSKKPITRLTGHQQQINHVAFSPDGRFIASASFDKKVKLWDGKTGTFLMTFHGHVGAVYQVCFSPDSRLIATASKDSTVKIFCCDANKRSSRAYESLSGHMDEVYALDWSPNGNQVATGSKDRMIKMWRA